MPIFLAFPLIKWALAHWRFALVILVIVATVIFGGYERVKGYRAGSTAAVEKIEKANTEEMRRAHAAAKTVDDCDAAGGAWDRDLGVCDNSAR